MNPITILQAGSAALDQLAAQGIDAEVTSDFDHVVDVIQQLEKPYLTPVLDPRLNDFTEATSMWIFLQKRGEYIGCLGMRRDDLGASTVEGYWRRLLRRHYPTAEKETITEVSRILNKTMEGRIVYIGDMFLLPTARGKRQVIAALTTLGRVSAMMCWQPDWIYCMIRSRDTRIGITYGFTRRVPNGLTWSEQVKDRDSNEVVLYANAEEVMHELYTRVKFPENN